jgi:hypothetical protein
MWGRVDGAGWLVHALLDPRRLKVVAARAPAADSEKAAWAYGRLLLLAGAPPPLTGSPVTEAAIKGELAFLDEPGQPVPSSLPLTSLWVARAWQQIIATSEITALASLITGKPIPGEGQAAIALGPPDRSPPSTVTWARKVLEQGSVPAAFLDSCPVPDETFTTDRGTPLMVRTLTKAAATTTAAVASVGEIPGPVRPATTTARTIALGAYRITSAAKGVPRTMIIWGLVLLALGIAAASQSSDIFGIGGLVIGGVGAYLVTFGAWQWSRRLLSALVAVTLTGVVAALATPMVRRGLFGTSKTDSGALGRHVHWLATAWWHPLLALGILFLLIVIAGVATRSPRRPRSVATDS